MINETLKKAFNDFYDYMTEHDIIKAAHEYSEKTVFTEALTAIYEIGLECIGADELVGSEVSGKLMKPTRGKIHARNKLRASQRKAWAKACGVAEK